MNPQRRTIAWAGAALLVVLAALAFNLISFNVMSSRMQRDSSLVSIGAGPDDQPFQPDLTGLAVEGNGRLESPLQKQMAKNLEGQPGFGAIQPVDEPAGPAGRPMLLVRVEPRTLLWTPFYSRADLQVTVLYDSEGDLSSLMGDSAVVKSSEGKRIIQRKGDFTFTDVSWGLISKPGYTDYLAREIAKQIAAELKAQK